MRKQHRVAVKATMSIALALGLTGGIFMLDGVSPQADTTPESLFDASGTLQIDGNASYTAGNGKEYKGTEVTASAGDTVVTSHPVYIGDNGLTTPVLELLMTPEKSSDGAISGWAEAEKITVTFTDAYNAAKFVEVTIDTATASLNLARTLARAGKEQVLTGNKKGGGYDAAWAVNTALGLGGMGESWSVSTHQPYAFYLDGTKLYVSPARAGASLTEPTINAMLIRDFSAEINKCGPAVNDVFDSDVVNISVTLNALGVDAQSNRFSEAHYMICSVDGQSLGDDFSTTDVRSGGVPVLEKAAVVNTEYVLPAARTFGFKSGAADSTGNGTYAVKNAAGETVALTNNKFTPKTAGVYTVSYTENGKTVDTFLKVLETAAASSELTLAEEYPKKILKDTAVGLLPASLKDNGFNYGNEVYADAEILKGTEKVYSAKAIEIAGGAGYIFAEKGNYTIRYTAKDSAGAVKTLERNVEVYYDATFSLKAELTEGYETSEPASFPVGEAVLNDTQYPVSAKLIMPDGNETALTQTEGNETYNAVEMNLAGEYTLVYSYPFDGETRTREYKIFVGSNGSALFAADANSETISVSEKGYSYTPSVGVTDSRNGILVTATQSNDSFSYQEAIRFGDSLEKSLLEFMIVSDKQNVWGYDFQSLQITLTDKYDATKQIVIDYSVYYQVSANLSMIKAAATGQTFAGWHRNADGEVFAGDALNDKYGTFVPFGFDGTQNTSASNDYTLGFNSIKLYLKDNSLYVSPARWKNLGADADEKYTKVRDFGSSDKYGAGYGDAFEGFTTDEVYLSVRFSGIAEGKTAKVLLLGLNGQSLENKNGILVKNEAPSLSLGRNVYENAWVGSEITVFQPSVYDVIDGKIDFNGVVKVECDGEEVSCIDGKFKATKAGTYTVAYSDYTDGMGAKGETATYSFTVADRFTVSDADGEKNSYTIGGAEISFDKNDLVLTDAVNGIVSDYTLTVSLYKGETAVLTGSRITLDDSLAEGEYKLVFSFAYTADGAEYKGEFEKNVTVIKNSAPPASDSEISASGSGSSAAGNSSGGSGNNASGCGSVVGAFGTLSMIAGALSIVIAGRKKHND